MRLIGSRTESIRRSELLHSEELINNNKLIVNLLSEMYGEIKSVYVLTHTPDQAEDIYRLIVNGDFIVGFELSRIDNKISEIFDMPVVDYSKQIKSKSDKLELAIAIDLAANR
ncbi:hypothetical protein RHO15_06465 [Utexia brackfieldae]|uniref:hypothetical protein n=1 Tax=Utexia brackfieldae TaxID=3074108 RepID=UPI00370D5055